MVMTGLSWDARDTHFLWWPRRAMTRNGSIPACFSLFQAVQQMHQVPEDNAKLYPTLLHLLEVIKGHAKICGNINL